MDRRTLIAGSGAALLATGGATTVLVANQLPLAPDPIFAAVAEWRYRWQAWMSVSDIPDDEMDALGAAQTLAVQKVITTVPTTLPGFRLLCEMGAELVAANTELCGGGLVDWLPMSDERSMEGLYMEALGRAAARLLPAGGAS
ncbi:hypothetical protein KHC28_14235 [Ancylobacter sonchi]|uniref:hypothetical protein n=1 Tax=Ancylobacter sonchi TaxID=1937790 RepID=UPI001BD61CF5|nr:hypothetical protein [Ancylobacter sonchi]MBS7534818.1 hypothetical protein [Ancylobacter sonchi]